MEYTFPVVLAYDRGHGVSATFPDLEASTCGVNEREALASAPELLAVVLGGLLEDGMPIPEPSRLEQVALAPGERTALVSAEPAMTAAAAR